MRDSTIPWDKPSPEENLQKTPSAMKIAVATERATAYSTVDWPASPTRARLKKPIGLRGRPVASRRAHPHRTAS